MCEELRRKTVGVGCALALVLAAWTPGTANAAPLTEWQDLQATTQALPGLGGLLSYDASSSIRFFGWSALSDNSPEVHPYLDFGLVMYEANSQLRFGFVNWMAENEYDDDINSSITDIYFHDAGAPGSFEFSAAPNNLWESAGPDFRTGQVTPGTFDGQGSFVVNQNLSAESTAPIAPNGIEPIPEWVVLGYEYRNGSTFESVYNSLVLGDIRIAMRVQGLGLNSTGGSDAFIWTPLDPGDLPPGPGPLDPNPVVPLPGAAGLGLLGFGMVAFLRRKRGGGVA